ncbi:MAG: phosphate transporter, permease protein PstC [Pseudomonadota bacterium]
MGDISNWNDAKLQELNPGKKLPNQSITVVHRADGSGTTFIFTDYLTEVSPEWKAWAGKGAAVKWPAPSSVGGKGNEGVAANVGRVKGAIGYVEYAYAKKNKIPHLALLNRDGKYVEPDDATFAAAAAGADWFSVPGMGISLVNQKGAMSWPITGASFALMYKQPTSNLPTRPHRPKRSSFLTGPLRTAKSKPLNSTMFRSLMHSPIKSARRFGRKLPTSNTQVIHDRYANRMDVFSSDNMSSPRTADQPANLGRGPAASMVAIARRQQTQDFWFHKLTMLFSLVVLVSLIGIIASLLLQSLPTFQKFGLPFIWRIEWDIINEEFGALISIFGTLASATIALLIAVPLSFGIALFLTENCPVWLRRPLGTAVELLAAVPSIIYGMFGLFIFAPLFAEYGQPALQSTLGQMPLIGPLFGGAMNGIGILAAGLILAFMILPFIAAVMRDVFEIVPPILRESAYGIGCTTWEVVRYVVLPYTQKGVIGGVMLGLGRALGETMAVTFVIGNSQRLVPSLFAPGSSIASTLANEFAEAGDFHLSALFALGFLLFIITFVVLALAKLLVARNEKSKGAKT